MNIELRPYQLASIQRLREGLHAGHRAQILAAPTGAGKTICGAHLLQEAHRKGTRAAFVVDRVALCDQTSAVLDICGIPHGVVQAGHWRRRAYEPVQVCSAQTLEKRGFFPSLGLLIVDEAHCMRKQTSEFVQNTSAAVIGLTATPFTKGMGKLYSNLVNVTTTRQLVEDGFLVQTKMYAAKTVDMKGAKVVAGEWADSEIERRGIEIIGDIVAEWQDKTRQHFGGPVKTIVFSATVAHGDELCRQFNAAGFNFQQISYKDGNNERRREFIEEFRKADSAIQGLVSCEVFTKGFDVPDILCLAEGSSVLTHRGLVAIEKLMLSDRVWDGIEFVEHDGPIFKGEQDVITYAGLTATASHEVKTAEGWRTFGQCASEQIPIVKTGLSGLPIRESEGHFSASHVARPRVEAEAPAIGQAKRRVWDILNAGPRNRFTCEGLLVHNCGIAARPYRKSLSSHIQQLGRVMRPAPGKSFALWLDHAGNALRFKRDTDEFFANGVNALDDGERDAKPRKEVTDNDKREFACSCGYVIESHMESCPACGKVRARKNLVEIKPGRLVEIGKHTDTPIRVPAFMENRHNVWQQLCQYATLRKPGEPDSARKRALALYRAFYGEWPRSEFAPDSGVPMDPYLLARIRHENIKWAKSGRFRRAA